MYTRMGRSAAAILLSLAATGCAASSSGSSAPAASAFDGRYAGPFILDLAASAHNCPAMNTEQAVMTIRGGDARVDVDQATYFSGHVGAGGALVLTSGQGLAALISGRITGGTYVAAGSNDCQYQVRLTRVPPGSATP